MRNDSAAVTTAMIHELRPTPRLGLVPRAAERPVPGQQPRLRSEDLFQHGNNELLIEHQGECYRLRLTRHNKLILNK